MPSFAAASLLRRLPDRGLPGPANPRRAYADQNAPLLLFFFLRLRPILPSFVGYALAILLHPLLSRLPLVRAGLLLLFLLLFLVILLPSKSKGVLFIWLSWAELLR